MSASEPMKINALLKQGSERLSESFIEGPARDARILLAHVMKVEPARLLAMGRDEVGKDIADRFTDLVAQRAAGKPVYRIIGSRDFFGREFMLNQACLEPRPETELLVERVVADMDVSATLRFCDIGTGSGAIAVTLLCELPNASAIATDIEPRALDAARENARAHDVLDRLALFHADCLTGVSSRFDFIVSNPPYIATNELAALSKEVREHDPRLALDGGEDGLIIYRRILVQAAALLEEGGRLYLETGHDQHDQLEEIARKMGWGIVDRLLDLSGLARIVVLERTDSFQETASQNAWT